MNTYDKTKSTKKGASIFLGFIMAAIMLPIMAALLVPSPIPDPVIQSVPAEMTPYEMQTALQRQSTWFVAGEGECNLLSRVAKSTIPNHLLDRWESKRIRFQRTDFPNGDIEVFVPGKDLHMFMTTNQTLCEDMATLQVVSAINRGIIAPLR